MQPGFSPTLNPGKTSLQPSSIFSGSPSSPAETTKSSSLPTNHCMPLPLSTSLTSSYHAAHPGTISSWTLARCPSPTPDSVLSVSSLPPSGKNSTCWHSQHPPHLWPSVLCSSQPHLTLPPCQTLIFVPLFNVSCCLFVYDTPPPFIFAWQMYAPD